jgi:hypothetical protein
MDVSAYFDDLVANTLQAAIHEFADGLFLGLHRDPGGGKQ